MKKLTLTLTKLVALITTHGLLRPHQRASQLQLRYIRLQNQRYRTEE